MRRCRPRRPCRCGRAVPRRPASCPPARPAARPTGMRHRGERGSGAWPSRARQRSAAAAARPGTDSIDSSAKHTSAAASATSCRCAVNAIRTMSGSHWWRSIIGAKSRRSTGSNRRRASAESPLLRGQRQRRQAEVTALPLAESAGACACAASKCLGRRAGRPGAPRSVRRLRAAAAPPHPVPWRPERDGGAVARSPSRARPVPVPLACPVVVHGGGDLQSGGETVFSRYAVALPQRLLRLGEAVEVLKGEQPVVQQVEPSAHEAGSSPTASARSRWR